MRPLNTAIVVEGPTDRTFLRVLIDRSLREIGESSSGHGFDVAEPLVLQRVGDNPWLRLTTAALDLSPMPSVIFFHYDGSAQPEREERKAWRPMKAEWDNRTDTLTDCPRLVPLVPIREMESWALADLGEVCRLAGTDVGKTAIFEAKYLDQVERLTNPKRTLDEALRAGSRRRRRDRQIHDYLQILAERVALSKLRSVPSFDLWRTRTVGVLRDLNFID